MNIKAKTFLFEHAKFTWGEQSQVIAAAEEFSEASAAMCQYANGKRSIDHPDVISELADAEIMSEQMRFYFSGAKIDAEKDRKLLRLAERLGCLQTVLQFSEES